MALVPPLGADAGEVIAALAPLRHDFSVAVWTPGNPFAIGAIIRVAHNFLAKQVLLVGSAPYYAKATMGMHRYEVIRSVADEDELRRATEGLPLWAIEKDAARCSIYGARSFPPEVVFVFGSERFGLPESLLRRADNVVGIPVYGVNQSLPLAVAAGIVMSEWTRRRYAGGATV